MKKLKFLFIAIICCVCLCFAFAGCTGKYVYNSYDYTALPSSDYWYRIEYSFEIGVTSDGDISVDYVLTYTTKDGREMKSKSTETFKDCKKGETKTVSNSFSISSSGYDADSDITLSITKIYPANYDDKSVGYAIGFGVAGGLILGGVIALFVALKSKKKI